jgi:hypothetical protein
MNPPLVGDCQSFYEKQDNIWNHRGHRGGWLDFDYTSAWEEGKKNENQPQGFLEIFWSWGSLFFRRRCSNGRTD